MSLRYRNVFLLICLLLSACVFGCSRVEKPRKRLLLFLVADQLPQEYLERYAPLFSGGLKRLLDEGAVFTQARFMHAKTETCPGHTSLVSGVYPAKHGVVSNSWYRLDGTPQYCVRGDDGAYSSNSKVSSLVDWVKKTYPKAKTVSISAKNRSAIAMVGKQIESAYWLKRKSGKLTTLAKAKDSLAKRRPDLHARSWFPKVWDDSFLEQALRLRHPEDTAKGRERYGAAWYGVEDIDAGDFSKKFPHSLGGISLISDETFFKEFYESPFADELVTKGALAALSFFDLGANTESIDVLAISFSALDLVGHKYGPHSREVLDTLLRLDAQLEILFKAIDERIGLENVLISFSSDHGIQALPESRSAATDARRADFTDVLCVQNIASRIVERLRLDVPPTDLFLSHGRLNRKLLSEKRIDLARVLTAARDLLEECDSVARVWTTLDLERKSGEEFLNSAYHALYQNSFYYSRSPDLTIQFVENFLPNKNFGTSHGSPYGYDRHVPLIIKAEELKAGVRDRQVDLVDLAPSLASLLGITPGEGLDGESLFPE